MVATDSKVGRLIKLINGAWVYGFGLVALIAMAGFAIEPDNDYLPVIAIGVVFSQLPRAVNYVVMGKPALFWKGT